MAFETPPAYMDGTTLDAENFRRALGTIITGGGIVTAGDCAIAQQSSPNMSVKVGPGQVWVYGTSTTSQGPYYSRNGADTTLTIAASSPSNPRIDTIIVQVQDVAYAGALKQIAPAVITGTPTGGATLVNLSGAGAVPASSLVLGYVLVPTSATSIVTANISNVVTTCVLPGHEWSYTQITSNVNITDTAEATATALISPAAFTPDGAPVIVEFFSAGVSGPTNAAGASVNITLWEGATQIGRLAIIVVPSVTAQMVAPIYARYRFTPTNAAHTYKIAAYVNSTTGTPAITAGVGGTGAYVPAYVRFTKA